MKKIIIVLFLLVVMGMSLKKENSLIPKDAIRFRVIANSNSENDQIVKLKIKSDVEKEVYKLLRNINNIEDARKKIKNNIHIIEKVLQKYNIDYNINYGNNYFPEKIYKGITYEEGNYESLVITLGEGLGHNWWCVLFPPLCLLDEEDLTNYEYELYITKLINNYN